jgi:hypothetical protein
MEAAVDKQLASAVKCGEVELTTTAEPSNKDPEASPQYHEEGRGRAPRGHREIPPPAAVIHRFGEDLQRPVDAVSQSSKCARAMEVLNPP